MWNALIFIWMYFSVARTVSWKDLKILIQSKVPDEGLRGGLLKHLQSLWTLTRTLIGGWSSIGDQQFEITNKKLN